RRLLGLEHGIEEPAASNFETETAGLRVWVEANDEVLVRHRRMKLNGHAAAVELPATNLVGKSRLPSARWPLQYYEPARAQEIVHVLRGWRDEQVCAQAIE